MNIKANTTRLSVQYVAVEALKPDARNARTHSKTQIKQIVASIREFGFTNPILIDPDSVIIAGHGRLRAARELGLNEVPTITLAGLSEAQKRALRLADNKIALGAGWDLDILRVELADLSALDLDIDLAVTGFSVGEIDALLDTGSDPDDAALPAVPSEPRVRSGQIWQLGEHFVGCGDCRDRAFLQEVIGDDKRVDAAFLDPPYNVKIGGHANSKGRHREFEMASGEMSDKDFRAFLNESLGACASVSKGGAVHFICMDWRHIDDLSQVAAEIYGARLNICVWNKSNAGMGSLYRSKGNVRGTWLEADCPGTYPARMEDRDPFKYFKTSREIIRLAVMLYVRFPLSLRNVEDLLHERGIDVSHEAVRFWWHRFGPLFAAEIRKRRVEGMRSSRWRWHLDEVFVKINGETHYLWRAVDHEGEVLESFVTKTRDKRAALKFIRKSLRRHGPADEIVTDKLRSYGAALRELGIGDRQTTGRWKNNRAENSHLPFRRRERAMQRFRRMRSLQKFAAVHASVHNLFNTERCLSSRQNFKRNRAAALAEWRDLCAA